jgi:hypothetical protein
MTDAELAALEAILSTPAGTVQRALLQRGCSFASAHGAAEMYAAAPALVREVRRLREALEEITRLGTGHSLDSALVVARAALAPPAAES